MNVATPPINILSLCSGIAGLDIGLKAAIGDAARTVAICESEAYCAAVLQARMQDGLIDDCPIWSDLRTFDGRPWRGVVDIITAGFPCQPFSAAGKRRGEDDPRHLWPYIAALIRTIRPAVVFCENVPGLLTLGFEQVCQDLSSLGYHIEAGIFSAAEIGAPHLRKRLFFVAYANSANLWQQFGRGQWAQREDTLQPQQHGGKGSVADAINAKRRAKCTGWLTLGRQDDSVYADGQQGAGGVADSRAQLADTASQRQRTSPSNSMGVKQASGQRQVTCESSEASARRGYHQGHAQPRLGGAAPGATCGVDYNLWHDGWEDGVPRVASAQPHRIDRLRALGNAVVPGVAALAWDTLVHQALARDTLSHAKAQDPIATRTAPSVHARA